MEEKRETILFVPRETLTNVAKPSLTTVEEVLGHILVEGDNTVLDAHGIGNSTRWVFQVTLGCDIAVRFLDFRSGRPMPLHCLALTMAPLNEAFWAARPFFGLRDGLVLLHRGDPSPVQPRMLVTVDALAPHELRGRGL